MVADQVPLPDERGYLQLVMDVCVFLQSRGVEVTYIHKYGCIKIHSGKNVKRVMELIPVCFNNVVYSTDGSKYIVLTREGCVEIVLSRDRKYIDFYIIK